MIYVANLVREHLMPLIEDNALLYFIVVFITSMAGGIDDELATLITITFIFAISKLIYREKLDFKRFVKIYLLVCIGHILDLICKFTTSLRNYIILYYTYNTLVDLMNLFSQDEKLKLPSQIKKVIEKLKKE